MKSLRIIVTVLLVILFAASPGFAGRQAPGATPVSSKSAPDAPKVGAHVFMVTGFTFKPRRVIIKPGEAVEWKNTTEEVHTVTDIPGLAIFPEDIGLPAGAHPFNSGGIMPGGTYRHTFKVPGLYKYFCKLHEVFHMTGEVVVTAKEGAKPRTRPSGISH